jgi:hypothetical protein
MARRPHMASAFKMGFDVVHQAIEKEDGNPGCGNWHAPSLWGMLSRKHRRGPWERGRELTIRHNLILTSDINPLGVTDPTIPFTQVQDRLHAADVVFANLACCFYEPEAERSPEEGGFYAP